MLKLSLSLLLAVMAFPAPAFAAELQLSVRHDFPGGNVLVQENRGARVQVAPDLRGGKPWFYWHFEATANQPGRATFAFPGSLIGVRGPAVSYDSGTTWQWHGTEQVEYGVETIGGAKPGREDRFHYDFTPEHLTARFCVAMPYLQQHLDAFLQRNAGNTKLTPQTLCRSQHGRLVELLQIGTSGPDKTPLLFTARHHACESMASYLLEGIMQAALDDSRLGVEFRRRHVLYVVPIVDKDGVEAGDQGKWRSPHDHNRDYGNEPLYPEVRAIQELAQTQQSRHTIDVHCPALKGDVHEVFYFDGLALPHINDNVNELIGWLREERPPVTNAPLNFMKPQKGEVALSGLPNSHYFATRPGSIFAATLEVPYAQPKAPLDVALARAYGEAFVAAWLRATFITSANDSRGEASYAALEAKRTDFQKRYRGQAPQLIEQADAILADQQATPFAKAEARLQRGTAALHLKQFASASTAYEEVVHDPLASLQQRNLAWVQSVVVATLDPAATPAQVESRLVACLAYPYLANEHRARGYEAVSEFYLARNDFQQALKHSENRLTVAAPAELGRVLLRIAKLHEQLAQPEKALAARQAAIDLLRRQLDPVPVGGHGAAMALDLFQALQGLPTATLAEQRAAAEMVFAHKVSSPATIQQVRQALAELEAKQK